MNGQPRQPATVAVIMPLASQQGGAEALLQHLLRAPRHLFRYTCLFLEPGPMVEEARALGYQAEVIRTTHLSDVRNYVASLHAIHGWLRRARPDLVLGWMQKAYLYAAPASLAVRTRRMWFQHGLSKTHWMDVLTALLPVDAIVCCSAHAKQAQDRRFPAWPAIACHPGIADAARTPPSREQARAALGLDATAPLVGMVARLERWKGAHVFVQAAAQVLAQHPRARFFLVGGTHPHDPAYAEELAWQARQLQPHEPVLLAGQRPAQEIPLWHAAADLIVHPVIEPEPFGMAVAEAMAASRAVIASRAGGLIEIIEDGVSGVFVPPNDIAALSAAIVALLNDPARRERIAHAAAQRARHFTAEAFVHRFEQLVHTVLAA